MNYHNKSTDWLYASLDVAVERSGIHFHETERIFYGITRTKPVLLSKGLGLRSRSNGTRADRGGIQGTSRRFFMQTIARARSGASRGTISSAGASVNVAPSSRRNLTRRKNGRLRGAFLVHDREEGRRDVDPPPCEHHPGIHEKPSIYIHATTRCDIVGAKKRRFLQFIAFG